MAKNNQKQVNPAHEKKNALKHIDKLARSLESVIDEYESTWDEPNYGYTIPNLRELHSAVSSYLSSRKS